MADTNVFRCHIRIYVTTDGYDGEIMEGASGHYDLQIDNNGSDLSIYGQTFTNPVFSYGAVSSSDSTGQVCIASESNAYIPNSHYKLYYYTFWTTAEKVAAFINEMKNKYLKFERFDTANKWAVCTVQEGPFKTYDFEDGNCFLATKAWCSSLGDDTLANVHEVYDKYYEYYAYKMYEKFGSAWTLKETR